jgi:hypothetical protein
MPGDCASCDELTRDSSQFAKALSRLIKELTLTSNCSAASRRDPHSVFGDLVSGLQDTAFRS